MEQNGLNSDRQSCIRRPLCQEPWQSYYILRRGIMPCCYGHRAISPADSWESAWNCAELQEIRSYLAKGQFSPYCLLSLSCPSVRRYLRDHPEAALPPPETGPQPKTPPPKRPLALRLINRALGGVPGRIYGRLRK